MVETNAPVHLILSWAPLLSGGLSECLSPDDESCEGGVAAVAAYARHYCRDEPHLVIPFADKQTPFVQMHPLGWSVNRLVLNKIMGWEVFGSTPSLLTQNSVDYDISYRDISDMQSKEMPLLLTNVAIPPGNSWYQFAVPVYFDEATGLATMVVWNSNEPLNSPQIESTTGVLDYIARVNSQAGCGGAEASLFDRYVNRTIREGGRRCWVPVVMYADVKEKFDAFRDAIVEHENPPALLIDVEGNAPPFKAPRRVGSNDVWLVSYFHAGDEYFHHKITLNEDRRSIKQFEMVFGDLAEQILIVNATSNVTIKDEQWRKDINTLREQADEASANDPIVGVSTLMPVTREGTYRRCKGGECEIGNLFTDAARWWADADVAFAPSGGLRGEGWPAGNVTVSNIWDALPFPNLMCTGTMNGVSLFRLFNYSINVATFEGENTSNGDRLLQVSGMKVTYNTEMEGRRIVKMETLDKTTGAYEPVERLKLYDFVTDSYVCGAFDPFPSLLGEMLTGPGEVPAKQIDGYLYQNVVGDYLSQLGVVYQAGIKDRLVNDTTATEPLNLIQTADACSPGTYWLEAVATCEACPDTTDVAFLSEGVEFDGIQGDDGLLTGRIVLVNTEIVDVAIVPRSKPSWLSFSGMDLDSTGASLPVLDGVSSPLKPGEKMTLNLAVTPGDLEPGTAQGTVSFGVLDGGNYPGCTGQDATFEVLVRISPEQELNQLGSIRYTGWLLAGVVLLCSIFFTSWVIWKRQLRIVKTLQPFFLVMISMGVLVMGSAIIPLSIDDENFSRRGCDIACMAVPWLLSMGFTIAMAALFSKLWRINKLFTNSGLRRMKVEEKDVMAPFAVLFTLNFIFLLVWTVVDPLQWYRVEAENQPWSTFGTCRSSADGNNSVAISMFSLVIAVNATALFVAGFQAYQARNISDEFSESKNMGVALFSWIQLVIVGFPVLYLIDEDNPSARYFLQVILIFAISMSMLLLIFVPMMIQAYRASLNGGKGPEVSQRRSAVPSTFTVKEKGVTRISGLGNFGVSNFEQLSNELAKLSYMEHNPSSDSDSDPDHDPLSQVQNHFKSNSVTSDGQSGLGSHHFTIMESLVEESSQVLDDEEENEGMPRESASSLLAMAEEEEESTSEVQEDKDDGLASTVDCSEEYACEDSMGDETNGDARITPANASGAGMKGNTVAQAGETGDPRLWGGSIAEGRSVDPALITRQSANEVTTQKIGLEGKKCDLEEKLAAYFV